MKIAYLLGSLNRGGTENLLLDTLGNINESEVEAICIYRMKGLLYNEFMKTGVEMYALQPKNKFDFSYILKLRRILKGQSIQIAHAQQPIDAFYAYLACLGLRIHVVLTIHGYDFKYPYLTKLVLNFIHKRIAYNIFVSNAQKDYFVPKYKFREDKVGVIYNGISFKKLKGFEEAPLRVEFNIPENHLLLGSVGNFNPARDQMTICRFLNLLNKEQILFSFIFAGAKTKADPWYYENCYNYCKDQGLLANVFFPGSRNDVPNILGQLDAFVYSTDHDTFGIAIIEAIYMEVPVFVNDWAVFTEVTEQGVHAHLYKTKNEYDLLKHFKRFIEKKDAYIQKAKEDSVWAQQKYSINNHIINLNVLYSRILNN